jgi:hypothetical protein
VELPPPVFLTLPEVEGIEATDEPNVYRVMLRESGGEAKTALFTVGEDAGIVGSDWDIFWRWPGDAESVRSVARQVQDFDRDHGRP